MAKQTITQLVCDGCETAFEESAKGSSDGSYNVAGEDGKRHVIDLCADCTAKLPAGTVKNRPGRKGNDKS